MAQQAALPMVEHGGHWSNGQGHNGGCGILLAPQAAQAQAVRGRTAEGRTWGTVTATPGDGQVTLNWTWTLRFPNYDGFEFRHARADQLYRTYGRCGGLYDPRYQLNNRDAHSQTIIGLTNGVEYKFQIWSRTGGGTLKVRATPLSPRPAAPKGLTVTPSHRSVPLSWDTLNDPRVTRWEYEHSVRGKTSQWQRISGSNAPTTSYTIRSLEDDVSRSFRVRAAIDDKLGDPSGSVSATPRRIPCTLRLNNIRGMPGPLVTLTWSVGRYCGNMSETQV